MKKLLKENKGSTLLTTMFFILVVALLTISLHLALISMIDKVTAAYDEQQAYVSARGIATTIVQSMDTTSAEQIETINDIETNALIEDDLTITDPLLSYLEGIALDDFSVKALTDITITDSDGNVLVLGDDVTGTVKLYSVDSDAGTATYLLSITTTYGDAEETVTLSITRETVQYPVYSYEETETTEAGGYLSGFYLDFMPYTSSFTYAEDSFDNDDAIIVCASPMIYTNPEIYFSVKAHVYCEETIVLVGNGGLNGATEVKRIYGYDLYKLYGDNPDYELVDTYVDFFSKEDIYLKDVSVIGYANVMASGDIYLYGNTVVGDYAVVTCDTLYIDDDVKFGNEVIVNAKKIEFIGDDVTSVTVGSTNTEINIAYARSSLSNESATIADKFGDTEYSATLVFSMAFPNRNIPTFVTEYESASASKITSVTSSSYSFTGSTSNSASSDNIIYTFYALRSGQSYTFDSDNFSEYSDTTPIVIYVPSGVTVTITDKISSDKTNGVYFYLDGTAKLINYPTTTTDSGDNSFRVYSAQPSNQDSYEASMLASFENYGGIQTAMEICSTENFKSIQESVFNVLNTVYNNNAGITSYNAGEITGTITATILKASSIVTTNCKDTGGLEVEYNQSNDLGTLNITREEWVAEWINYNSYNVGVYVE